MILSLKNYNILVLAKSSNFLDIKPATGRPAPQSMAPVKQ